MRTLSAQSRNIVIITTGVFIVLVAVTMKLDAELIAFGYPWAFYSYSFSGGAEQTAYSLSVQPLFFILEWLMIAALVIMVHEGFKKVWR